MTLMNIEYKTYIWLFVMIFFDLCFLGYGASGLSISYKEALILYELKTPLHYFVKLFCDTFSYSDFALRLPFVILHTLNILLLFEISKKHLKKSSDALLCIFIYMLLPGINTAALVVNEASSAIFFTLLFVYSWQKRFYIFAYIVLFFSLAIDNSFVILYLSLIFYAIFKKQKVLLVFCVVLFCLSLYIYGFETHGKPKGYFLDTIGVYAATLSPLVMMYYAYTLYRIGVKEKKHILWYISFGAFVFTLIFSLRQKLALEDFLPFAIISVPLMVKVFLNSYRVRLPRHRNLHKLSFSLVICTLVASFFVVVFNKTIYAFSDNPKKHFAYKYNIAKELSLWLKGKNITSLDAKNEKMQLRLKFYGIIKSEEFTLVKLSLDDNGEDNFKLDYFSKPIARYKVIKNEKK